jgi:hypothetical protein
MSKPMIRIHNTETNEIIDREMNAAEYAQYKLDEANTKTKQAEAEAKETARVELLNRLGITADEAQLLLG